MNTKRIVAGAGLVLAALMLTGCASDSAGYQDEGWRTEVVQLPDGRAVTCVLFDGYDGDTIACDWEAINDSEENN